MIHNNQKDTNDIKELILRGNFLKTREIIKTLNLEELESILLYIGKEKESFCAYTYVCFLLLEKETAEYHNLAAKVLRTIFPQLEGSSAVALYHENKARSL